MDAFAHFAKILVPVVFFAAISTILFGAIGKLLVDYRIPPFTLPFNFAASFFFMATYQLGGWAHTVEPLVLFFTILETLLTTCSWRALLEYQSC